MISLTLKEAIREFDTIDGSEYLCRLDGKNYYWEPSNLVRSLFIESIGNKWAPIPYKASIIQRDLRKTNIVLSGKYIMARGGLCPSGVKLAEVTNINELEKFLKGGKNE